jgi:glucose-6-phosphate isomerase
VIDSRIDPGPLAAAYERALGRLDGFADRLWSRSAGVFPAGAGSPAHIAHRLGWLGAVEFIAPHLPRLRRFAQQVRADGFTDIVLLGMGGSSLAADVFRQLAAAVEGRPRLHVLDSVDPDAVRRAMGRAATSLFVLASKSGTTVEVDAMAAEAERAVAAAGHRSFGPRAIAITDAGSPLEARAAAGGFRDQFINPSDIGGRYSALSFFGMVPAALVDADLDGIVARARAMAEACRASSARANPGVALGALLGAACREGRDKLTAVLPPALSSLGLWIEQLVAESTGKQGTGIVPVVGEPIDAPWGEDRVVIDVGFGGAGPNPATVEKARAASAPTVTIDVPDGAAVGAEFFRWEVATAAAAALLGVNPFDEPDVQRAKDATRALLDRYRSQGRLAMPEPHGQAGGARVSVTTAAAPAMTPVSASSFLDLLRAGDYCALLAYVAPDDAALAPVFEEFRAEVAVRRRCATTFAYGPRYLHSTGQLHKGGPDTAVFLLVTAEPEHDLAVPGSAMSFGTLELAQAIGDFESLDRTGRRAMHLHLPDRSPDTCRRATAALLAGGR